MESRNFWKVSGLLAPWLLLAQTSVLTLAPPAKITVKRGATVEVKLAFVLADGYHTNSHTPSESYLIPLRLSWDKGPLEAVAVVYPKPHLEKYEFSPKPLSVFTGTFEVTTKFQVPAAAPNGPNMGSAKLRYQACNNNSCLPPKTIDVKVPVIIL
jgi:hypothetical protein